VNCKFSQCYLGHCSLSERYTTFREVALFPSLFQRFTSESVTFMDVSCLGWMRRRVEDLRNTSFLEDADMFSTSHGYEYTGLKHVYTQQTFMLHCFLRLSVLFEAINVVCTRCYLPGGKSGRDVKLTTHLYLVPRCDQRISGFYFL
jgi:hypothetical protein